LGAGVYGVGVVMSEKLQMAQDILGNDCGGDYGSGFNMRVSGYTEQETNGYPAYPSPARYAGWVHADNLIREGKIFSVHRFNHMHFDSVCKGYAFPYGGSFVCNTCERSRLEQPWWTVKVRKDGSAFHCIGLDFINLMESNNHAFGDTKEEALANYEALFMPPKANP